MIANASDITATNMAAYLRKSLPRFPNRAGSFVALFAIGVIGRPTYNATCNHVEQNVVSTNDTPAAILNNNSVVHPAARPSTTRSVVGRSPQLKMQTAATGGGKWIARRASGARYRGFHDERGKMQ
ncbi:MAG: hypothetical protein U1E81_18615 [Xanthobacteraceae bacterium]